MRSVRVHIYANEVDKLYVDLTRAPLRVQFKAAAAMRRSAAIVDVGMTTDAKGHKGNWFGKPGTSFNTPLQKHVSHEMIGPLTAEIGIEYVGAGQLGHIIALGSINNAPAYDHTAALRRSMSAVEKLLADAGEESVFGAGGDLK